MTSKRWIFFALGLLTLLRLWVSSAIELAPDEAYYYQWSLRPDLCYFSKGPGVAVAIRLGTMLLGACEAGVRLLSPLLSFGTAWLLYSFTRRLFSERTALWALVASSLIPILNVGSVLMTIDPLSIFFWTAALYSFWLALEHSGIREEGEPGAGWSMWWPFTGMLIGLGFLCKWTNGMQLVSILLLLLSGPRLRRHFRQPGFWMLLLVFLIFTLPPLIWNAQHLWITFSHLSQRGGLQSEFQIHPSEVLAFLGAHAGVYSPILFLAMLVTLAKELPRARDHFKPRFLLAFTLPLFLMYLVLSIKKAGEANWTAPAMISLVVLAAADWTERARQKAGVRRFLGTGLALGVLLSVVVLNINLLRHAGIPFPLKRDPSKKLRGWRATTAAVEKVREESEKELGTRVFLIANGRALAAEIAFYLKDPRQEGPGHPAVYTPESQAIEDQYSLWPRYDEFVPLKPGQHKPDSQYTEEGGVNPFHGRTALFISDSTEDTPPGSITGGFEKTDLIACVDIDYFGMPLRQVRIFQCTNYRGRPL
jgi:4-amino-4-deoxy-L-arabinose transferase-like glycosyltransferase